MRTKYEAQEMQQRNCTQRKPSIQYYFETVGKDGKEYKKKLQMKEYLVFENMVLTKLCYYYIQQYCMT